MNKLSKDEYWVLESGLKCMQDKMAKIESKLAQIEGDAYDADPGEIEAIHEALEDEYRDLEKNVDKTAFILRHSFTGDTKWEDDPGFDHMQSEMKKMDFVTNQLKSF